MQGKSAAAKTKRHLWANFSKSQNTSGQVHKPSWPIFSWHNLQIASAVPSVTQEVSMHRSCLTALQQPVHRRDPPPEKQEHTAQSHATSGPQPQRWRAPVTRRPCMSGTRAGSETRAVMSKGCRWLLAKCTHASHACSSRQGLANLQPAFRGTKRDFERKPRTHTSHPKVQAKANVLRH